ncbi:MAG: TIGR01777 family oxidoreductase [Balneolaceae bacterium]|nr:TIGR01777 family oxidoreductase [Balneolaceae bacterium]
MTEKQILITGGTGFIGSYLREELLRAGNFLTVITRSPIAYKAEEAKNQKFITWDDMPSALEKTDVVINLAGETLFGKRWTESVKESIYNSRIKNTRRIVDAMRALVKKPSLFISASAVGIYGDCGDTVLTEESEPGDDFLAKVCKDWEIEALLAEELGVRVAIPRIGIVLEKEGGVIEKMLLPFKLFAGGPVGSGEQYMPWIHMHDLCRAILLPMEKEDLKGPYNACSPEPETMRELASAMGRVMRRPSVFRVPEFVLKAALGEAAQPVVSSLRVKPEVLITNNFQFDYTDLETALADIL